MMASRRDFVIGAAAAGLSPIVVSGTTGASAAEGKMALCMHTTTSAGAGYRGALEGWAKAGIKNVELNAIVVNTFLKTDTLGGARNVLKDNGLTAVHGALAVPGLIEPNNSERVASIEAQAPSRNVRIAGHEEDLHD
jgi:sugar phosphate isomerase/epimerase